MYHINSNQLRVSREIALDNSSKQILEKSRLLVLQHILPDTAELLQHLKEAGAEIHSVVAKPYSINQESLKLIKENIIDEIVCESYSNLEKTDILQELIQNALEKSQQDSKHIIIIDVGGYFARPLANLGEKAKDIVVIEDTTFGHNRYFKLSLNISALIFSVARSKLKEIEAHYVGHDAVAAADQILRRIGISISGRNALVLGYGMIGKNIALALRRHNLDVGVYDKLDLPNLHAFTDGYRIHKKVELLKRADIIFSATGSEAIYNEPALSYKEIVDYCGRNIILVSAGSKDTEFEITEIINKCDRGQSKELDSDIDQYSMLHSQNILVIRRGTAVNFLHGSVPVEILDLVFSEIISCAVEGVQKISELDRGIIYTIEDSKLHYISKEWLRFANMYS